MTHKILEYLLGKLEGNYCLITGMFLFELFLLFSVIYVGYFYCCAVQRSQNI